MINYTQLSWQERCKIEHLRNINNKSIRKITKELNRNHSTISRELRRNNIDGKYCANNANSLAILREDVKRQDTSNSFNEFNEFFDKNFDKKYSGIETTIFKTRQANIKTPVFKTIYNWIQKCIIKKYRRDLLRPQNKSDKRCTEYKENNKITNGEVHILEHPEIINDRLEKGHFEIDLKVSKREHKGGLLTLVDRMTRFDYAIHVENKKMERINDKLLELKNTHNIDIKSITRDNGTEFNLLYKFEYTKVYFCNPYFLHEKEERTKTLMV